MTPLRTDVQSQTKHVIYNVYKYFKTLSADTSRPEVAEFFRQTQDRTAEACGVSAGTVKRINVEAKKSLANTDGQFPSFSSPRKTYKRAKYATEINSFEAEVVRSLMNDLCNKPNKRYTREDLLNAYQSKTGKKVSSASMARILKSLHYKYVKGRWVLNKRNAVISTTTEDQIDIKVEAIDV